jgi:hypothetical protein
LNEELLEEWRVTVAEAIARIETILVQRRVNVKNNSIFTFQEIAARGKHRFDLKLDLSDPRSTTLAGQLVTAPWMPVIRLLLGDDVSTIASVVYSRPGADTQVGHECVVACLLFSSA